MGFFLYLIIVDVLPHLAPKADYVNWHLRAPVSPEIPQKSLNSLLNQLFTSIDLGNF